MSKEDRALIIACLVGLAPWGIAALVTNWYDPTLSRAHAILLLALQLIVSLCTMMVCDAKEPR